MARFSAKPNKNEEETLTSSLSLLVLSAPSFCPLTSSASCLLPYICSILSCSTPELFTGVSLVGRATLGAMPTQDGFQGVSKCYVFKSRLQEYSQKLGFPSPVYETIKEGPSHEPSFRSEVIVNGARYNSLAGFFNRKAAEQSAAEVALLELAKDNDNLSLYQPVDETGLCKNLLQEYAQKMNYAMPLYHCQKDESAGRATLYSCTVEIGGIRCIGAVAKTKKEAEIKAARTALLAIKSSTTELCSYNSGCSQLTVIPSKKRGTESIVGTQEASDGRKAKKPRFKKKNFLKKLGKNTENAQESIAVKSEANTTDEVRVNLGAFDPEFKAMSPGLFPSEPMNVGPNESQAYSEGEKEKPYYMFDFLPVTAQGSANPQLDALISSQGNPDSTAFPAADNRISGTELASGMISTPIRD